MRLPRLRFSMRWLMVVVAVAALLLSAGLWVESMMVRSRNFLRIAAAHGDSQLAFRALEAEQVSTSIKMDRQGREARMEFGDTDTARRLAVPVDRFAAQVRAATRLSRERSNYHGRLRAKYLWAARYPCFSVEPDPPGP
jgi:hypothetical protein